MIESTVPEVSATVLAFQDDRMSQSPDSAFNLVIIAPPVCNFPETQSSARALSKL